MYIGSHSSDLTTGFLNHVCLFFPLFYVIYQSLLGLQYLALGKMAFIFTFFIVVLL